MDFKDEVKERLKTLDARQKCQFAWLCGVRALPFLSVEKGFKYWSSDKQKHLYSIFFALDITAKATNATYTSNSTYFSDAAAAFAAASDAAAYAADVADVAAAAAAAAAFAAASDASDADVSDAAAAAAAAAADAADAAKIDRCIFEKKNLNDIDDIVADRFNEINIYINDEYKKLWENFASDLHEIGCGYWAKIYMDFISNGLNIDLDSLERRMKVPKEMSAKGAAAVAGYLENVEEQGSVLVQRETRLIILGSPGSGKTTLAWRLNGNKRFPKPEDTTHGVDTSIKLNFNGTKTHIWDFGGQVIYHSSHRCFMSANCIYILVINARIEDNRDINRINYWLDTIRIYSENKAKVFIIFNESDNRELNIEDYDAIKNGEFESIIQDIYSFNIGKDKSSLKAFREILADYIAETGHRTFGQKISRAMKEIKAIFDKKRQILEIGELEEILSKNDIKTEKDQQSAKELFDTLGVALSYDIMGGYVLDPYWISHGVYKVIDFLQKKNFVFLNYNKLDAVFADERGKYPEGKREYIISLMEHHKIGFSNKGGIRGLIVPCVASQFKPKNVVVKTEPDSLVTQVERDDLNEFPADFFYRYIYENQDDIKKINGAKGEIWSIWQTGMVLAEARASALVELIENRRIEITVWGEGKEEYSYKLETLINDMLIEYNFESSAEKREKGGKIMKFITAVVKEVAKEGIKGLVKAFL